MKYRIVNPDFVNTSEAYSKLLYIGNNNLVVPYVNIGILPANPINGNDSVVEYSYYIIYKTGYIIVNTPKDEILMQFHTKEKANENVIIEYIVVGGYMTNNSTELKISCKSIELFIPEGSTVEKSSNPFIAEDNGYLKQNMRTEDVNNFFSFERLPVEILEILGDNICAVKL
jgi:hypothetical protein